MSKAPAEPLLGPSLLGATLASLPIGVVPALASHGSWIATWLVSAASAAFLLGPASLGLGTGRLQNQVHQGSVLDGRVTWLVLGLLLSLAPLMVVGGLLKSATHHRPLGAATFAFVACAAVVAIVVFIWRLGTVVEGATETRGRWIRSVVGGAALLSGGWVLLRLGRLAASHDFAIALVELALLVVALWLGTRPVARHALARVPTPVGVGAWLSIVVAGAVLAATWAPATGERSIAILWLLFAR
jgi:hypothetical protein